MRTPGGGSSPAAGKARACSPAPVALTGGFVVIWVIASMLPFLWTLWGSFKVGADFFGLDWMHVVSGEFTKKQTGPRLPARTMHACG